MSLVLIELLKLRRDKSVALLSALAVLPVATGIAGAVLDGESRASELAFFVNNQYSMFFPMAAFMLAGFSICREWKDGTYLTWVSYGIPRSRLLLAKAAVCFLLASSMAVITLSLLVIACLFLSTDGTQGGMSAIVEFVPGFAFESLSIVSLSTVAGLFVGAISRSPVATSVVGVIHGFASCLFIGTEWGFIVPGSFAYRVATSFLDSTTYYDDPLFATAAGIAATVAAFAALAVAAGTSFSAKRGVES